MSVDRHVLAVVATASILLASCAAPVAQSGGAPAGQPGGPAPPAGSNPAGRPTQLNMDEIFPPGEGRELVLQYCTNCHTITPIALARETPEWWANHRTQHRPRVVGLSDQQADLIWSYLTKNFNPDRPVPDLPKELLDTWTSY